MHTLEPPMFNTFGIPHHVAFMWLVMLVVVYLPVHLLLRRLFPVPGSFRTRGGA